MKTKELIKQLSSKILGKMVNPNAIHKQNGGSEFVQLAPVKKAVVIPLDGLGVIQLPEHWRN